MCMYLWVLRSLPVMFGMCNVYYVVLVDCACWVAYKSACSECIDTLFTGDLHGLISNNWPQCWKCYLYVYNYQSGISLIEIKLICFCREWYVNTNWYRFIWNLFMLGCDMSLLTYTCKLWRNWRGNLRMLKKRKKEKGDFVSCIPPLIFTHSIFAWARFLYTL